MTQSRSSSKRRSTRRKSTHARAYRVNARLDADVREKLTLLENQMDASTSDVLREAVTLLYASRLTGAGKGRMSLDNLVGKFSGAPRDLSENYKTALSESLASKHDRS